MRIADSETWLKISLKFALYLNMKYKHDNNHRKS